MKQSEPTMSEIDEAAVEAAGKAILDVSRQENLVSMPFGLACAYARAALAAYEALCPECRRPGCEGTHMVKPGLIGFERAVSDERIEIQERA